MQLFCYYNILSNSNVEHETDVRASVQTVVVQGIQYEVLSLFRIQKLQEEAFTIYSGALSRETNHFHTNY